LRPEVCAGIAVQAAGISPVTSFQAAKREVISRASRGGKAVAAGPEVW
jgi:hypothetical protein